MSLKQTCILYANKISIFFSGCLENHWFTMDSRSRITINEFELVVDEKFCLERKYWEFTYSSIKSDSIIDQNMWTSTVYKKFFKRWFGIDPIFDKFDDVVGHEHDFRIITIGNSWNYYFKTRILDWKIGVSINQVQCFSLQMEHFLYGLAVLCVKISDQNFVKSPETNF